MDEDRFWELIECAWQAVDGASRLRRRLFLKELTGEELSELEHVVIQEFEPNIRKQLDLLPKEEFLAFNQILEAKLDILDRDEIYEYTGGSDDGFFYSRGYIVAAGKEYFNAVNADPSFAHMDLECEELAWRTFALYATKFG